MARTLRTLWSQIPAINSIATNPHLTDDQVIFHNLTMIKPNKVSHGAPVKKGAHEIKRAEAVNSQLTNFHEYLLLYLLCYTAKLFHLCIAVWFASHLCNVIQGVMNLWAVHPSNPIVCNHLK